MAVNSSNRDPGSQTSPKLHPLPVRIMHWINAVAMIVMISSGWGIYNDEVIFGAWTFPNYLLLGLWAPQHLQWHFLAMWFLGLNGLAYVTYGFVTGRFRRKFLPIRVSDVITTIRETLKLHLAHEDLTVYNAVQKLLYIGVLLAATIQIISGIAIWKPVQFSWLMVFFYDFQTARIIHFLGMAAIVGFLVVHVALALLVPKTLVAMVNGGPDVPDPPAEGDLSLNHTKKV